MRSEERLDPASAGHTETADVDPPTPTPRNSKREIGQGIDAGTPEYGSDTLRKPEIGAVAAGRAVASPAGRGDFLYFPHLLYCMHLLRISP